MTTKRRLRAELAELRAAVTELAPVPALPNLGLATTRELLDELRCCRIALDYYLGGGGLDYSTVNGRPDWNLA